MFWSPNRAPTVLFDSATEPSRAAIPHVHLSGSYQTDTRLLAISNLGGLTTVAIVSPAETGNATEVLRTPSKATSRSSPCLPCFSISK